MLVAEYETDGSMKFITGEDLELLVMTISNGNNPGEIEFWWRLQAIYKVVQGIFDELEVEGFLRERFTEMQATELSLKTRSSLTPLTDVSKKGSFRGYAKQWLQFENILYFRFTGSW